MEKQPISAKVPEELATPINNRVDQISNENQSDAVRYFLRRGIEADRQPATDGGRRLPRFTFVELLTLTVMTATIMTWVLAMAAGGEYLRWALALTAGSGILLAVYFGEFLFSTINDGQEVNQ